MICETLKFYVKRLIRFAIDIFVNIIGLIYPSEKKYSSPITDRLLLEPEVNLVKQIKSGKLIKICYIYVLKLWSLIVAQE
jgi:hypothetical protein